MMDQENIRKERAVLAEKVIRQMRRDVAGEYRYLTIAIYYLKPVPDAQVRYFCTDGEYLFYNVDDVFTAFAEGKKTYRILKYRFLHILAHCMMGHLENKTAGDTVLYDQAADFYAERFLRELTGIRRESTDKRTLRNYRNALQKASEGKTLRGFLNHCGRNTELQRSLDFVGRQLKLDSHERWLPSAAQQRQKAGMGAAWQYIRRQVMQDQMKEGHTGVSDSWYGNLGGDGAMEVEAARESLSDYRALLRRLCRLMELPVEDEEEYDLLWYQTGLVLYGNRPILEPLETSERNQLTNLFIAIDTSGSCVELAPQFLRETMNLVDAFTWGRRGFRIWILECDASIQKETVIGPEDELPDMEKCRMHGWGGTSFVPVFRYIEKKRKDDEISEVSALLYFSDAFGEFPQERPDYPVYFIIPAEEGVIDPEIPEWVEKVTLTAEGLMEEEKGETLWNQ